MARAKGHGPAVDWEPLIQAIGLPELLRQFGFKRVLEEAVKEAGPKGLAEAALSQLTPEQLQELKQRLP